MKKIIKYLAILMLIIVIIITCINLYIIAITKPKIKNIEELNDDIDCILVLGAGVRGNNPTPMLEDRLLTSLYLYNKKVSNKLIVSGDHGQKDYDEVNVMKQYLIDNGITSEDIFMDHAGFSTYDSIYRAKTIFKAKKVVIVTQEYHMYRALYIAKKLDLEAYGVTADLRQYSFQSKYTTREIAARVKEFINCIIKPKPKYLGETISLTDSGDVTNDK